VSNSPHVLVIAGTDSSGGAGLVRDVQVITELGARASCVITAVTAQTNLRVEASCVLSPELVRQQLSTALRSHDIRAIKVGMLGNGAIVRALLDDFPDGADIPIILDPVLCSSSGAVLLDHEGVQLLRDQLLPRCTLMTPNLIEAGVLLGQPIPRTTSEQAEQALALLRFGSEGVLLKGGHATDAESVDVLATRAGPPIFLRAPRLSVSMRGTGCALSSAIAALMAAGDTGEKRGRDASRIALLESACERAKAYVHDKLLTLGPSS
jgi:hydroxymethylpyrimidine/phosphomethylpyrimidine kinase